MLGRTEESRPSSCESIHPGTYHPIHSYPEHGFLVLFSAVELCRHGAIFIVLDCQYLSVETSSIGSSSSEMALIG